MRSASRCVAVALGLALALGGAGSYIEAGGSKSRGRGGTKVSSGAKVSRPSGRSVSRGTRSVSKAVSGLFARKSGSKPRPGATRSKPSTSRGTKPGSGSTTVDGHGHWGDYRGHYYGHGGYYGGYHGYGSPYFYVGWGWPYCWGWWPYYPARYVSYPPDPGEGYHPALAALELDVKPKKAEVWLDGEPMGQARDYNGTWDVLWVKPGGHLIEFRMDERQTLRFWIEVRSAGYHHFTDRMSEGEGLDPRSTERPPDPPEPVYPEPVVDLVADDQAPPPAAGMLRSGFLRIEAHPADAAVYLDGEFLARADELARLHGALSVAFGVHVIEVVRPGHVSQTAEAEVSDREPVRVVVRLERGE